jgi:ABC-type nitrate/sulfonate/bicarbonate transport system substrate-binding protein
MVYFRVVLAILLLVVDCASVTGAGSVPTKMIVAYDLVTRPDIKRVEDLRGKRFGVTSIGGTLWMGAVLGLERLGIDTNRDDIRFLVIGDQVVLSQALEDNRIDATVVDIVFSKRLHEKGFPILAEFNKTNLPIASTSVVARGSYIKKIRS